MEKIPVIFFGSGPVSLRSLQLLQAHYFIEGIVTKPSTVDQMHKAAPYSPIYTAATSTDLNAIFTTNTFKSSLGILIDFGIIVSDLVINYFKHGIINSHFSLLPEWRGADPITFALLSGQDVTGVSLMVLVKKMDEGPILAQEKCTIPPNTTSVDLTQKLINLSNELLENTLPKYLAGTIKPKPQDAYHTPTYSRKLTKADGHLDWSKPAQVLEREIRAFYTWPHSFAHFGDTAVIVLEARVCNKAGRPGDIVIQNNRLMVCCGTDSLEIIKLKPAGKTQMTAAAFLAGHKQRLSGRIAS